MCKKDYRKFIKIAIDSLLLFLFVTCTNVVNLPFACISISFSYFLFTSYMCKKYQAACSCTQIAIAVIIGRYLLELVSRVVSFKEGAGSLPEPFICLMAIFLGIVCHKKPFVSLWVVSIAIIIVVCAIIPDLWTDNYRDWLRL